MCTSLFYYNYYYTVKLFLNEKKKKKEKKINLINNNYNNIIINDLLEKLQVIVIFPTHKEIASFISLVEGSWLFLRPAEDPLEWLWVEKCTSLNLTADGFFSKLLPSTYAIIGNIHS